MDFDTKVKLQVYEDISRTTSMPDSIKIAFELGCSIADVEASFQRLHQKRLLVPEPGTTSQIRMAPPFSGIKTQHKVVIGNRSYFANCAWDALGVSAALHEDADIESTCGDCKEPMFFQVRSGKPVPSDCAIHFAVPASLWWKDIIFT